MATTETKGKKRYHAVDKSRRLIESADVEKQIKEIEKSNIPQAVKVAAIAGLRAESKQQAGIEIMEDTVGADGKFLPPQFRIFGPGFNASKQQSPRLLDLILDNVEFFETYRKTVWKAYCEE